MPYTTYYGPNTVVAEICLWLVDGSRRICISYDYHTTTGVLRYAAAVYRCEVQYIGDDQYGTPIEPTGEQMIAHAHTTARRYEIRPVIIMVAADLGYDDIIAAIRHEMCHGFGVKGPRNLSRVFTESQDGVSMDTSSDTSSNDFLSDTGDEQNEDIDNQEPRSSDSEFDGLRVRKIRYITDVARQNYNGVNQTITREYFITFRAIPNTGELLYGAAISRRPVSSPQLNEDDIDNHYATAIERMRKCPVWMRVPSEIRHQLKGGAAHREDVMYAILEKINTRRGGRMLIRGER